MGFWAWIANLAVSAVVSWLTAPDVDDIEEQLKGTLVNKASNLAAIPVIYGKRKVGGTRVFVETSGTDNQFLYIALVLCEGEVNSIGNVWIDDVLSTDSRFIGDVTITKHLGADNQSADSTLTNAPSWTSDHKLSGIAYLGIRLKWDKEVFSSIPNFHAEVEGRKCYDPRADSGTGDTIYTTNPAICLLDYLTNSRYGKGLPTTAFESEVFAGSVGTSSWHAAADKCEVSVTPYSGASSIDRYSCNAVLDTNLSIIDNVKTLLSGMQGIMPYTQGEYRLVIEDNVSTSAEFDFTEEHIIDGIVITGEKRSNKFNRVIVTFANPDKNWQQDQIEYPEAGSSTYTDYLSNDNSFALEKRVGLNTITNVYQAMGIARTILRKSRQNLRCSFLATSEALKCAVGDIVTVTHSTPDWTQKPFRVMDIVLQSDGTVTLAMVEHQNTVYTWGTIDEADNFPDTGLPNPTSVIAPTYLVIYSGENYQLTNNDGTTQPRMKVQWTHSTDKFVDHYIIQYTNNYPFYDEELKTDGSPISISGVQSGTTYNVRVKAVNSLGISSPWLPSSVGTTHSIANLVGGGIGVTTFSQGSVSTGYPSTDIEAGDLWFDTDDNNKEYRYDGTDPYNNSGWVSQAVDVAQSVNEGSTTVEGGMLTDDSVDTDQLNVDSVRTQQLKVDGTLTINDDSGAFTFRKSSYSDYATAGVFLGNRTGSTNPVFLAGTNESYMQVDDDGVLIVGADFADSTTVSSPPLPSSPITFSEAGVVDLNISSAYATMTFQMSGGGGGGGGAQSGSSSGIVDGGTGGTTSVEIIDANLNSFSPEVKWTATGGTGGATNWGSGASPSGESFSISPADSFFTGTGGNGHAEASTGDVHHGGNASGLSSGGGGGNHDTFWNPSEAGNKGLKGNYSTQTYTITNSTYWARITVGVGGAKGQATAKGGSGSSGGVKVSVTLV